MSYLPTCEENVFISEQSEGYVKYIRIINGEIVQIWEVIGICTNIGKCYQGAVNEKPILDCPIGVKYKGDCCPLIVNELFVKNGY